MAKLDELTPPFADAELDELHHPNFEVRADLRYIGGPRKINAIKLIRELTQSGLKEANELVEYAGCMRLNLPLPEAQLAAARFAEVGSVVEIRPHAATLLAYDPR
ncbi:MAG: ribosomal protein L7/L12, partial [Myxococcales bacterium]|nr:ribosomal protein L7/L12 [Myxococcales bacterium]